MITVFTKVFTIFAMIGLGYGARRVNMLSESSVVPLTSLLINISSPCLIIDSMTSITMTRDTFRESIEVLVVSACAMAVTAVISLIIVKVMKWKPKEDQGCVMAVMTSINTGFLGFPVSKAVFGSRIFFLFVIQNIVLNFYMYSAMILQLNYGSRTKMNAKRMLRSMCTVPTFATIAGCILLVAGIHFPSPVASFFSMIGDMTIPLSMIVVGVLLGNVRILDLIRDKRLVFISLCAEILMPLITYPLVNFLPITPAAKLTCIYAEAFPCAVITASIAEQQHRNAELASEGIALTTFFSLFTLPVISVWLMKTYGGLI